MRISIIAVVASILSVALAQQAYPTVPIASTVWNAGATVTRIVTTLGVGSPGATSLSASLPADLKSGYYSVRIGDSYSSYFVIRGEGPIPTGPLSTAVTTVSMLPTSVTPTISPTIPTSSVALFPVITTTPSTPKPTNGAGSLKAGAIAPVVAAAAAIVLAMAI
ncbi:hypothetical protein BGW39_000203 [Mortierella sp. 14UC]|nr:hypothetical protein BGW39_000203 [Mortierella sp. 14UC]